VDKETELKKPEKLTGDEVLMLGYLVGRMQKVSESPTPLTVAEEEELYKLAWRAIDELFKVRSNISMRRILRERAEGKVWTPKGRTV
jgi:F420-0:gamma-glutamyl ligase-like protein